MIKFAKVINEQTGLCEVGLGSNADFYKSIGMIELDVQQSDIDNNWYLTEKCPTKTEEQKQQEMNFDGTFGEFDNLDKEVDIPQESDKLNGQTNNEHFSNPN